LKDEDILDRDVRPFVEESDSLQGFQVIMESDSAWAGFGSEYLEALNNEYPKACTWTWGIESQIVNSPGTSLMKGQYQKKADVC
jgi:hypothetical protein